MKLPPTCLLILAALALPAQASVLPPVDLAGGQTALTAGLPDAGVDVALGRLVLGTSAMVLPVSPNGLGYGFVARATWRLSGLPGREPCFGLALLGGNAGFGTLPGLSGGPTWEGWFCQPGLAVAWPITPGVTLRAMGGPLFFTGVVGRTTAVAGGTGLLPFVPNAELGIRLAEGQELTIGGLPGLIGWRGRL